MLSLYTNNIFAIREHKAFRLCNASKLKQNTHRTVSDETNQIKTLCKLKNIIEKKKKEKKDNEHALLTKQKLNI